MRPPATFLLLLLTALAACGTPQERCIRTATAELRTIDRLIDETEGNLARGYALEPTTVYRTVWVPCAGYGMGYGTGYGMGLDAPLRPAGMCIDERPEIITQPKAIDLSAEQRMLDGLRQKRQQLSRDAKAEIDRCRTAFPET
jgi:hypothetical protein